MPTISELKKRSLNIVQEIASQHNEPIENQKIGSKKYEVAFERVRLIATNTGATFSGNYIINVEAASFLPNSYYPIERLREKEIKVFSLYFDEMVRYFLEYARLKEEKGIILVHSEHIPENMKNCLKNAHDIQQENEVSEVIRIAATEPKKYSYLGAVVTEEFNNGVKNFRSTIATLAEVIGKEEFLQLQLPKNDHPFNELLLKGMIFHYHGEMLSMKVSDSLETINIFTDSGKRKILSLPLISHDLEDALIFIEEENKMKNLLNPPMIWYSSFLKKECSIREEEVQKRTFEKFLTEYESWEKVERIFLTLLSEKIELQRIIDTVDSHLNRSISVKTLEHEGKWFFFIKKMRNFDHAFDILIADKEYPQALQQQINAQLYEGLFNS